MSSLQQVGSQCQGVMSELDRGRTRVTLVTSKAIFVTHPCQSLGFIWVSAIIAPGPLPEGELHGYALVNMEGWELYKEL